MNTIGHNTASGVRLKSFVERIERVEGDIAGLNGDKKEIYAEAKEAGFDPKIIRLVVRDRRMDARERKDQYDLFDLYWAGVHGGAASPARAASAGAERFVNSAVPDPGDSVSLTVPDGAGVAIRNEGGEKVVEAIPPHDPETGEIIEEDADDEQAGTDEQAASAQAQVGGDGEAEPQPPRTEAAPEVQGTQPVEAEADDEAVEPETADAAPEVDAAAAPEGGAPGDGAGDPAVGAGLVDDGEGDAPPPVEIAMWTCPSCGEEHAAANIIDECPACGHVIETGDSLLDTEPFDPTDIPDFMDRREDNEAAAE